MQLLDVDGKESLAIRWTNPRASLILGYRLITVSNKGVSPSLTALGGAFVPVH